MEDVGFYNGEYGRIMDLKCSIMDRGMYFGDGCYDATYVCNNVILFLEDHLNRFYNSCRLLEIPFQYSREELTEILYNIVEKYDFSEGMIYWQTTRGTDFRNHVFPDFEQVKPNLMAYIRPFEMRPIDKTYKVITLEDTRFLHCNIKTLNLIPSVIANQRAREAGCDEAIFHRGDIVTECAHSNVMIIDKGVLKIHPYDNLILPGIASIHLMNLARANGIPTAEEEFTLDTLMNAEEVLITSSGSLGNRVISVDGKPVGGKNPELLKKLQDLAVDEVLVYTKQK
ncbi:MAG: aminotransferase class IV [Oscillospiraceae bacterium]|nr:aminotransferase class IV [Oscillospiraceae bacterium]MDD6503584.1 aminotransferase class IV [Oscillospiraceae bacterium]MDY4104431.1 aminotransferase class IV [Oscillospiraceae bacterium]